MNQEQRTLPFELEEININREAVLTYETQQNVTSDELLTLLLMIDKEGLKCIQRIPRDKTDLFEITYIDAETRGKAQIKLGDKIVLKDKILTKCNNREVTRLIRRPLISVIIYEAPYEMENVAIEKKLEKYGTMKGGVIRHKFKGTNVENGVRSVLFHNIQDNIPTTLHIQGNKLRVKYEGQDRTPICSFCKERGHYKAICEVLKKQEQEVIERCQRSEIPENVEEEQLEVAPNIWQDSMENMNWHEQIDAEEEENKKQETQEKSEKTGKLSYSEVIKQKNTNTNKQTALKKGVREIELKYQHSISMIEKKKRKNIMTEQDYINIRRLTEEMKRKKREFLKTQRDIENDTESEEDTSDNDKQ